MGQMILRCLLVCLVLLLRHGLSEQVQGSQSFQTNEISGTYIYLNTSAVTHSAVPACPHNISIHDNALQTGGLTDYSFSLGALNISEQECIYRTEQNETVGLRNHTIPNPMMELVMWNLTLPESILRCLPDNPGKSFPGGNFSFIPTMQLGPNMQSGSEEVPEEMEETEETERRSNYILVLENVMKGQVCTFFPEAHYKAMKEYIDNQFGGNPWSKEEEDKDDMKIGKGKSLKFCRICNCQEKFGSDLDLDTIEMSEDEMPNADAKESTEVPSPEAEDDMHWHPPKVLVHNNRCPVNYSKKLQEVIGEESMSEDEHDHDAHKETKDFVLRAVVNKLYDELRAEYEGEWDEMDFDMRKEMVVAVMTRSLRRRRVMVMKRGSRCGKSGKPIDEDTVLMFEKKHILLQLEHDPFMLTNPAKVKEILTSETETEHAFTLHVLRKRKGRFSACALSNSRTSCKFLNSSDFCKTFKPLGSVVATHDDSDTPGGPGNPGKEAVKPGDKDSLEGDKNGPPSNSSNPGGKETAKPSPQDSKNPGKDQGKESPSPTPTSVVGSPSPTGSPSGSSSDNSNAFCFPAAAKVELEDGSIVRMDELAIGDSIRDETGGFSRVILFTHANKDVLSEFIRLETEGADIVLSAQHYIPVNGKLMTAESVREGNVIFVLRDGRKIEAVVTKVERVWMAGLFNPQTVGGFLAVRMNGDAVVASAYTAGIEANVAHTLLAPLRMLNNLVGIVVPLSWLFKNGSENLVKMLPSGGSVVPV